MRPRRKWIIIVAAVVLPLTVALTVILLNRPLWQRREAYGPPKPEAPPDLEKLRAPFIAGLDALRRGDGAAAVKHFGSFSFGSRGVEQYRLYFLGQAYKLSADSVSARRTFAALWERNPRLAGWADLGTQLSAMYATAGDERHASLVASAVAERSDVPAIAANARWAAVRSHFVTGDVASMLYAARNIVIKNPRAAPASQAIDMVRALTGTAADAALPLTSAERLERAVALMRAGDPQDALEELNALAASGVPSALRQPLQLNRGLTLNQLRRFEDSNKLLEPLAAGPYRFAIPAIYTASKNYRILSASINPMVTKTIIVKKKVGTIRIKRKGHKKPLIRPKYAKVKKTIQLVDLAKKAKKATYERLSIERLKDLLSLRLADDVRIEVLNSLITIAESKNEDDYERELITRLAAVDPSQEAGLQHFWDKAWAAYARGDLKTATDLLTFIRQTYRSPNVRRQAEYWYARSLERLGRKAEAAAIYAEIAAAPYLDLYAVHAIAHGAPRHDNDTNPLKIPRADWPQIAQMEMPEELRLAYELTALTDFRDARIEVQKNLDRKNQPFADALMGDLYNSSGDTLLMMRALRRAFPKLATVEQDSVPPYFLRMYYPTDYHDEIVKDAKKNGLDPYVIMGLIHQESYYNPKVRSAVGATGLMQLMPATAREIAAHLHTSANLEDPENNVELGTYYFRTLVNLFGGNVNLAIASYNAGMGNVMRWRRAAPKKPMDEFIESIPFPETRNYVKRVNMLGASYRRLSR